MAFLPSLNRAVRTQLGFAILFILLGAGNIIFGSYKAREYKELLKQAISAEVTTTKEDELADMPVGVGPGTSPYTAQMRARVDFYVFVIAGGKWILAVAGFFLLLALVGMRESPDDNTK